MEYERGIVTGRTACQVASGCLHRDYKAHLVVFLSSIPKQVDAFHWRVQKQQASQRGHNKTLLKKEIKVINFSILINVGWRRPFPIVSVIIR